MYKCKICVMAQPVKVLAAKPDHPSSIPRTYVMKQVVLRSPYMYHGMHMPPQNNKF